MIDMMVRLSSTRLASLIALASLSLLPLVSPAPPASWAGTSPDTPQIPRDAWKDCLYNEKVIRCQDSQGNDRYHIVWIDGIRSTFWKKPPSHPEMPSYWADRYGGLWRRELLIQGNTQLTNLRTGNRIVVPLRYPCKPPAKGEVGYCRE